jgi:hypothetical protein
VLLRSWQMGCVCFSDFFFLYFFKFPHTLRLTCICFYLCFLHALSAESKPLQESTPEVKPLLELGIDLNKEGKLSRYLNHVLRNVGMFF